jgi:hypothetical protein
MAAGDRFLQLPNAVTSTVDHPLGSPSIVVLSQTIHRVDDRAKKRRFVSFPKKAGAQREGA